MPVLKGIPASPGVEIATVLLAERRRVLVEEEYVPENQTDTEAERFISSLATAKTELFELKDEITALRGEEHIYVIDTHLMIFDDPMLKDKTINLIRKERLKAEAALKRTIRSFSDFFSNVDDEYLKERGHDVELVGERILRHLTGVSHAPIPVIEKPVILVAHDLSPSEILLLDRAFIKGIVTDLGGKTSHTAILARALDIPAVVGLDKITSIAQPEDIIAIDGGTGEISLNPSEELFNDYLARKHHYEYIENELAKLNDLPAESPDGFTISLKANMEFSEELPSIISHAADGVGLFRTEMLFFGRDVIPDEEEQFQLYCDIASRIYPKTLTIRTLDAGGDKFVKGLSLEDEMNPALGLRAIRLSLRAPETFLPQIKAILRAGVKGNVKMFFPMISGVEEIRRVKKYIEEAKSGLKASSIPYCENMEIGVMIEIPSAVLIGDILAKEVDFFSVGTNDLIQYSLAIDRTNEHLVEMYNPLHPAVLRSLKKIVDDAHAAGIRACICGEMAGDPQYLPVLFGLGFDELSMSSLSIAKVKKILRRCPKSEAVNLVERLLKLSTAAEIEELLKLEITTRFSESFD